MPFQEILPSCPRDMVFGAGDGGIEAMRCGTEHPGMPVLVECVEHEESSQARVGDGLRGVEHVE
jgi:hypothetical protein